MYRNAMQKLIKWKGKANKKPLIIYGARQVGKTWLMQEFGKTQYKQVIYVNFDDNRDIHELFMPNLEISRIITSLEAKYNLKILPNDTLLIFDEIQECNRALVSLKYFCENAPEYNIVAAGSFLGVAMHEGNSFPVGKVDMMTLYPLSFAEFLKAIGEERLEETLNTLDFALINGLKSKFIELLKHYYYVGGMPEAVASFSNDRNFETVRQIQKDIIDSYHADFSKHIISSDIPKAGLIWNCIPAQLAKDNKKFLYSEIKQGARAREYENAIRWLVNSGLVYQVNRVSLPNLPLISYQEQMHFKLFMIDIGLLSAKSGLDIETILEPNTQTFTHFKGSLTEQYVAQELKSADKDFPIFYWANNRNTSEVDFIIQQGNEVIPIEVKSSINLKSKSLKSYIETFKPKTAIRSSLENYSKHETLHDIPLYLIGKFEEVLKVSKKGLTDGMQNPFHIGDKFKIYSKEELNER